MHKIYKYVNYSEYSMDERQRNLLIKQNPWWRTEKQSLPEFERDLVKKIVEYLNYKQILAIVGLRRVGKTIILKQIIQRKLKAPKNNICYISFDDIDFQNYRLAEELINYFLEYSDNTKKRYLFLDEIQKVPHWADLLKTYYDIEENLKIIISGSASLEINTDKETLAGRILSFHLPVLTFKEYCRYHDLDHSIQLNNIIREYDLNFSHKKERYKELFNEYLIKGAFPELLDISLNKEEYIKKYVKESVVEKSITDIARLTGENEKVIYDLFKLLSQSNARLFEIVNLSNVLKINRNKTSKYLHLLEKSFLIKISYNFTASVAKQIRASKKQYLAHSTIVISMLNYPFNIIQTEIAGHLVEGIMATSIEQASFWRTPQKDEVDIVTAEGIPIEVKYQSHITPSDQKNILKFSNKFKMNKGILLTKDHLDKQMIDDTEITHIPSWLFLLTQKN